MASKLRVVPKISGNAVGIFVHMPATGQSRQTALIECPNDNQLNDNVELAEEICRAYRKRLNRSI